MCNKLLIITINCHNKFVDDWRKNHTIKWSSVQVCSVTRGFSSILGWESNSTLDKFKFHGEAGTFSENVGTLAAGIDAVSLNANLEIGHYDWRDTAGDFDSSLTRLHEPCGASTLNSTKIPRWNYRGGNARFWKHLEHFGVEALSVDRFREMHDTLDVFQSRFVGSRG